MLLEKFLATIKSLNLFEAEEKIVLAVSGGPDSVCMTCVLHELAKEMSLKLHIAHLDHMFRGEASREDAHFVVSLAEELGITYSVKAADMPALLKTNSGSPQALSREVRYQFLSDVARNIGATKIVLGHNKNDQAETVLLNLIRGAGTQGLAGMSPMVSGPQGITLVRPLLPFARSEITGLLEHLNQPFRVDASNLKDKYQRNHVRHHLIPFVEQQYNPAFVARLYDMAEIVREENDCLQRLALGFVEKGVERRGNTVIIDCKLCRSAHPAVLGRVCRQAYAEVTGSTKNLTRRHSQEMRDMIFASHGSKTELYGGVVCEKIYNELWLYYGHESNVDENVHISVKVPGETECPWGKITTELVSRDLGLLKVEDSNTVCLDWDLLSGAVFIRNRRNGDSFTPLGMNGRKKLKNFLIDEKVPYKERNQVPLLVTRNEEIAWIIPYRISNKFRITGSTKNVLVCRFEGRE